MMSRLSPVHIVRFFQLAMPAYAAKPMRRDISPRKSKDKDAVCPAVSLSYWGWNVSRG